MCGSYVTLRISTYYLDAEVVLSNKWAHGDSVAWAIEHRGIVSFCNELWNVMEHVLSLQDPPEQFDHSTDLGTGTVKAGMVGQSLCRHS